MKENWWKAPGDEEQDKNKNKCSIGENLNIFQRIYWEYIYEKKDTESYMKGTSKEEISFNHRRFLLLRYLIYEYFGIKAIKGFLSKDTTNANMFYKFFLNPMKVIRSSKILNGEEARILEREYFIKIRNLDDRIGGITLTGCAEPDITKTKESANDSCYYDYLIGRCFTKAAVLWGIKIIDIDKYCRYNSLVNINAEITDELREEARGIVEKKMNKWITSNNCKKEVEEGAYISKFKYKFKNYSIGFCADIAKDFTRRGISW